MAASPPAMRPRPPQNGPLVRGRGGIVNIEDEIRAKYYVPAPSQYRPMGNSEFLEPKKLGKISEARHPSVHDHLPKQKAFVPGPGSYHTPDLSDFQLPEGGRVNRQPPVDRLNLDAYSQPGPGQYGVPNDPSVRQFGSGKFGKTPKVSKFIQDEVIRSRHVPAPGEYEIVEDNISLHKPGAPRPAKPFCPEGGKTLHMSRPQSYFDVAPKRWSANPAPDRYNLPAAVNANKAAGRLCFKYESATINETKSMVNKIATNEPGPGHYNTPDPEPLGSVPTLKGRQLSHGMPAPYNYNCAPDLGRKFQDLAPVRSQNSGDQIYGIGVRRPAVPRFTGLAARGSRPSSAGSAKHKVHSTGLEQVGFTAMDVNPEDMVQWRSGGFSTLNKSKSDTSVRSGLHPIVEDMKRFYPSLSNGKRGQKDFMPMAVRRPVEKSVSKVEEDSEIAALEQGKINLALLANSIEKSTSSVMEPLDVEKLHQEALGSLIDKAKNRMEMEGVPMNQQKFVIDEMLGVLEEKRAKLSNDPGADDTASEAARMMGLPADLSTDGSTTVKVLTEASSTLTRAT